MNPLQLASEHGLLVPLSGTELLRHILRDADTDQPSLAVDGSMLEEFMRCPRASLFKHVYKRASARPKPELVVGQAVHTGLEVGNKAAISKPNMEAAGVRARQMAVLEEAYQLIELPEGDHRHLGRIKEVLTAYYDGYVWGEPGAQNYYEHPGYAHDDFEIVEAEKPFSIVLGEVTGVLEKPLTVIWEGKVDRKVRDENGLWPWDYKTAKDFGDKYWNSYKGPSSSMHGYCWSTWRAMGTMPRGFIVDVLVIRKPTERPTSRTPPRNQFERRAFPVEANLIRAWEHNTLATVEDWLRHAARGYYPQYDRKGFNCAWCQYLEVCQQPDDRSALTLLQSGDYEDYTWSPLNQQE